MANGRGRDRRPSIVIQTVSAEGHLVDRAEQSEQDFSNPNTPTFPKNEDGEVLETFNTYWRDRLPSVHLNDAVLCTPDPLRDKLPVFITICFTI